jgi:hypothetical protein
LFPLVIGDLARISGYRHRCVIFRRDPAWSARVSLVGEHGSWLGRQAACTFVLG